MADLEPPSLRRQEARAAGHDDRQAAEARALFVEAVAAREDHRPRDAVAGFRKLQARFPAAEEALVASVSLGDLLLKTRDASEALAGFQRYLAHAPVGVLAPEALAGRVRALEMLGRREEAAETQRELVRRFPRSPYAKQSNGAVP